jgi:hypothetical protein
MRGVALMHKHTASARPAAAVRKPWAFCLFAVRTSVQQALATQKHRHITPPSMWSPQPNSMIVMLVESDVSPGSRGILP